jgi:hypothetical protein
MVTPSISFPRPAAPAALDATRTVQPVKNASQTQETASSASTSNSASTRRAEQNSQILQASMDVSIKSANSSLALLYRTAIDRINAVLEPELGPNAIGDTATPVHTPEATAGRILSLSTAFYDAYAAQNKDKDPETVARNFVDLIRGGFERGFGEAKDILTGLGVMGEDSPIEQGINKTYALVMQGFDDFLATKLGTKPAADAAPKDTSAS